jgi:large subunit ribosomal protein L13e
VITVVHIIEPVVISGDKAREGKGFSAGELKAAEVTPGEAAKLGVPYDPRRRTSHEENVEALKEYLAEAKKAGIKVEKPRQGGKPVVGRVYRGKTGAGKKMRNLTHKK